MKKCPVCAAVTFDDAEVCYGCLYCFGASGTANDASSDDLPESAGIVSMKSAPLGVRTHADVEVLDDGKTIILHFNKTIRVAK